MKYGLVKLCTIWMTLNTGTCSGNRTFLKINQEKHSKPAVTKLVGSKNIQHFPPKLPSTTVEPTASKGTTLSGPDMVLDLPHSVQRVQQRSSKSSWRGTDLQADKVYTLPLHRV
jgi:hypothetical protein